MTEVVLELREGQGLVKLRLDFDAEQVLRPRGSMSSLDSRGPPGPPVSPSRFSLHRLRGADRED